MVRVSLATGWASVSGMVDGGEFVGLIAAFSSAPREVAVEDASRNRKKGGKLRIRRGQISKRVQGCQAAFAEWPRPTVAGYLAVRRKTRGMRNLPALHFCLRARARHLILISWLLFRGSSWLAP